MTNEELKIMDDLAKVWNGYCELPVQHPLDKAEFCTHLHALQEKLMIRDAVRNHPERFSFELKDAKR